MNRLADIIGHEYARGILTRALSEGRLHHSMIFHGPEAVGKRTVALALASTLNCLEPEMKNGNPVDSCGQCASCNKVDKGIHADVIYLTLERTGDSLSTEFANCGKKQPSARSKGDAEYSSSIRQTA